MNKEKKLNSSEILFFIIIGLMFINSLFLFIKWLNESEFKITKEECHNEINLDNYKEYFYLSDEKLILYNSFMFDYFDNKPINNSILRDILKKDDEMTLLYNEIWVETCEQVEVNKIIFNCLEDERGISCNEGGDILHKEDLTIDWLDASAECIEWCRERFGQIQCPLDEKAKIKGNYECSKYKLQDYTIEVLE